MEKSKAKKTNHITLSQIDEMSMCVFIINREFEQKVKKRLDELQAKTVSIVRGVGISRYSMFSSLKIGTNDMSVIFAIARKEDVRKVMRTIAIEFSIALPGNGKSFVIDIDGYLGAKAKFVED